MSSAVSESRHMTSTALGRLLVVDDEDALTAALTDTLGAEGYHVTAFNSAGRALATLRAGEHDLLLTDLTMPEMDGITLLNAARRVDSDLAAIVMTGHGTIDTAVKAMQGGALDYVQKPFKRNVLLSVIGRALDVRRLRLDNARLLQREREYTAELEMANRDLDAFSLSVSHDLRAPLRTIIGFSEILMADYSEILPQEGRSLLSHIASGTTRMDRLVEDLLRFCRFSRQPLHKSSVDCNGVVQTVIADLRTQQEGRELELRIGKLPQCEGDRSLLQQVFANLLSNAFKFTRGRTPAVIEVGCDSRDGENVVFVRDNGAGFDMKYADKLFGVFQRMHSQQQFEGTGVGLSIVRRIVERHGGRIWAESEPERGATFFVTLPMCVEPAGEHSARDDFPANAAR